jgi:phosphoglycolate phosphatase
MRFSHLLFDLDGTLANSRPGIFSSAAAALREHGLAVPHELNLRIGPPIIESIKHILGSGHEHLFESMLKTFRKSYATRSVYEAHLYHGILEGLQQMRERERHMYVVTLKARPFAVEMIRYQNVHSFFRQIYGPSLTGIRQTKTELLEDALRREYIPARHAVMIGDTDNDIKAARALGVYSIGVTWGFGSHEELRDSGAHAIVHSPQELFALLTEERPS